MIVNPSESNASLRWHAVGVRTQRRNPLKHHSIERCTQLTGVNFTEYDPFLHDSWNKLGRLAFRVKINDLKTWAVYLISEK